MAHTKTQTNHYNGFAIPLQPNTDLGLAMLIASEDGQHEPVAVVGTINEAREATESDFRDRICSTSSRETRPSRCRSPLVVARCRFAGSTFKKRGKHAGCNGPVKCSAITGATMPKHDHHKAAEHHDEAAKAHRSAAEAHEKGDHADASQHSQIANDHSAKANEASNIAHAKSTKGPKKL